MAATSTCSYSVIKYFFLFCLFLFSAVSTSQSTSNGFPETGFITLPVKADPTTRQYYTSIGIGTPQHNFNFVIDLAGKFLWYDCGADYFSSSYHRVPCSDSQKCPQGFVACTDCVNPGHRPKPGCTRNTCFISLDNPFTGGGTGGDMGQDFLFMPHVTVPRVFVSGCADTSVMQLDVPLLAGFANGTQGILGLARTQFSLPNQISSLYNVPPKFTLCLPSSTKKRANGGIFFGWRPSSSVSVSRIGFNSFNEEFYSIQVNSININGKPFKFKTSLLSIDKNGHGGTKISTTTPYTVLHHSIYKPLVREFVNVASDRRLKRVKSVKPFGACFDAKTVHQHVPAVNLVVEGPFGKENFDIVGHNLMVQVSKNVACLGFVDGGRNVTTGIVIGGRQLEERILEFDLSTSTLSFSSSLLLHNTSCSNPPLL